MKRLRITVNGNTYDVAVEEVSGDASYVPAAPAAPMTAVPAPTAVSVASITPAAPMPSAPQKVDSAGEGDPIQAPMPGGIINVLVKTGDSVKAGQVLIILEAMKMENEIKSPKDGIITGIYVNKGDSVDTGKTMMNLK